MIEGALVPRDLVPRQGAQAFRKRFPSRADRRGAKSKAEDVAGVEAPGRNSLTRPKRRRAEDEHGEISGRRPVTFAAFLEIGFEMLEA